LFSQEIFSYMKKLILIKITCVLFLLCSCTRGEIEAQLSQIILKEGEEESLKIDGEIIPVKLVYVINTFTEGIVEEKATTFYNSYNVTVSIGSDTLHFSPFFYRINGEPSKEKSWEDLSSRPEEFVKTFRSYQIGISNLYREPNPGPSHGYVVKLLIKK